MFPYKPAGAHGGLSSLAAPVLALCLALCCAVSLLINGQTCAWQKSCQANIQLHLLPDSKCASVPDISRADVTAYPCSCVYQHQQQCWIEVDGQIDLSAIVARLWQSFLTTRHAYRKCCSMAACRLSTLHAIDDGQARHVSGVATYG